MNESADGVGIMALRCHRCGWMWRGSPQDRPTVCPACIDDGVETHLQGATILTIRTIDDVAQAALERAETIPAQPAKEQDMEEDLIKQHDELRSKAARLLSNLVQDGVLYRDRGYRIAWVAACDREFVDQREED